jgi:hypothetical protein
VKKLCSFGGNQSSWYSLWPQELSVFSFGGVAGRIPGQLRKIYTIIKCRILALTRRILIYNVHQEDKMYQEKRPTCVTVISWAWIIIGGLMCASATMGLFMSVMMGKMTQDDPVMPLMLTIFPLLATVQIGVAVLGLVSGINFLKLKAWARNVLEGLTWLLLVFIIGFMVFWVFNWVSMSSGHGPRGFDIMGAVMGVVITGFYGVPLGIMLNYLRGSKVKNAINGVAEQDDGQVPPEGALSDEVSS